jgi:hypothetical protein
MLTTAMIYVLRTGCAWRAVPPDFGPWQTVYSRWRLWCSKGVWGKILRYLVRGRTGALRFIDSTHLTRWWTARALGPGIPDSPGNVHDAKAAPGPPRGAAGSEDRGRQGIRQRTAPRHDPPFAQPALHPEHGEAEDPRAVPPRPTTGTAGTWRTSSSASSGTGGLPRATTSWPTPTSTSSCLRRASTGWQPHEVFKHALVFVD